MIRVLGFTLGVALALLGLTVALALWASGVRFNPTEDLQQ